MSVIEFTKRPSRSTVTKRSLLLRSFRGISRGYLMKESVWQFAAEALFFAIIIVISAWPILAAASALSEFLQRIPN